ncbi:MAG: hypothetical protein K9M15_02620, partial [Candidatus Marinimicrobia bacterium]|nr:hypothetical protein [Candidatus Neomarinimicrobiota bacterium]
MVKPYVSNIKKSKLISLKDASGFSGYTNQHLGLLCKQEKLKSKKIGNKWFTTKEWIEEYRKEVENQYKAKDNYYDKLELREASDFSGYTSNHLSLLCRKGELKAKRVGKKWYTTKKWLDEYSEKVKEKYQNEKIHYTKTQ